MELVSYFEKVGFEKKNMTGADVDIAVSSKWVKVCFSANYLF